MIKHYTTLLNSLLFFIIMMPTGQLHAKNTPLEEVRVIQRRLFAQDLAKPAKLINSTKQKSYPAIQKGQAEDTPMLILTQEASNRD